MIEYKRKINKESYFSGEKALTKEEFEKLLKAVDNWEDELLFRVAVALGARREDIVKIRISDVDMEQNMISFYEKKKKRIKKVYFGEELKTYIVRYLSMLDKSKRKRELLFEYSGKTAYNKLQSYCDKAGIPRRPFHALRATCIKFAQANGWSMEQTAKHVGDTISVIQKHYSAPSAAEMNEVAKKKEIF